MAWQTEELFFDTRAYFKHICQQVDRAQKSVEIEMYIFQQGQLGQSLIDSLRKAAERGVRVRLIVDGVGSSHWSFSWLTHFLQSKIEVRVYHPVPWPFSRFFLAETLNWHRFVKLLMNLNRRTHRKLVVIDGESAYVGSMNVMDVALTWREIGVFVVGPEVTKLQMAFERTWRLSFYFGKKRRRKLVRLRSDPHHSLLLMSDSFFLNDPPRLRKILNKKMISILNQAQERIWITNPYFVPSLPWLRALCRQAAMGKDVRIILPAKLDMNFMRWVRGPLLYPFLEAGVKVYEYLPKVLHAKSVIVDQWVTVGTSNLNHRSLLHDLEVDIVLSKEVSCTQVIRSFQSDLTESRELTIEELKNRPWWEKLLGQFFLLFKAWL